MTSLRIHTVDRDVSIVVEAANLTSGSAEIEAFVARHPQASPYHAPAIARAIERGARLLVRTFVARTRPTEPICGILPVALTRSRIFGRYADRSRSSTTAASSRWAMRLRARSWRRRGRGRAQAARDLSSFAIRWTGH